MLISHNACSSSLPRAYGVAPCPGPAPECMVATAASSNQQFLWHPYMGSVGAEFLMSHLSRNSVSLATGGWIPAHPCGVVPQQSLPCREHAESDLNPGGKALPWTQYPSTSGRGCSSHLPFLYSLGFCLLLTS